MMTYQRFLDIVVAAIIIQQGSGQDFGYDGEKGPDHWKEQYAECIGKHQSPINIDIHNVVEREFPPLKFYNVEFSPAGAKLVNNGHTVMMQLEGDDIPTVTGGPLVGEYRFSQLHFHWGDNDTFGSENRINNDSYPMELHMVFYKTVYANASSAMHYPDGLTVLSFLYEVSEMDNPNYLDLVDVLNQVHAADSSAMMPHSASVHALVGSVLESQEYFSYDGSLTTPPCSEVVQWIEFADRVPLSHNQIEEFRHLYDHEGQMRHNFRPIQPINDRLIYYVQNISTESNEIPNEKMDSAAPIVRVDLVLWVAVCLTCIFYSKNFNF